MSLKGTIVILGTMAIAGLAPPVAEAENLGTPRGRVGRMAPRGGAGER